MSTIIPIAIVSGATAVAVRSHTEQPAVQPTSASAPSAKEVAPIRYYGGIDGMNATNLIVALQSNGAVSGGYSAQAIEANGTPPPALVDRPA